MCIRDRSGIIVPESLGSLLRKDLIVATLLLSLAGCDMIKQQMGIEDPDAKAARTDAEGKACLLYTSRCV